MLKKKQKMLLKQLKKKPNNTMHLVKNGFWLFRVRFLLLIIYTLNNCSEEEKKWLINSVKKHNNHKKRLKEVIAFVKQRGLVKAFAYLSSNSCSGRHKIEWLFRSHGMIGVYKSFYLPVISVLSQYSYTVQQTYNSRYQYFIISYHNPPFSSTVTLKTPSLIGILNFGFLISIIVLCPV